MKKEWLYLRFFDESTDVPIENVGGWAVALSLILTVALPVCIGISIFKQARGDDPGALQWMAMSVAISVIIAVYQATLRRRGHAKNQLILSALLLVLLSL